MSRRSLILTSLIVLVSGFVVMAFEIVGSRVLAPFMGSSTSIWVSIIAVILLAMSLGYYQGGRLADQGTNFKELAGFLLVAAAAIALMNIGKNRVLMMLSELSAPLLLKSTLASLVLFTIPAFFLASVFPYALRMAIQRVEGSGQVAGRIYAISTIGSVAGTFCSILLLIPYLGTTNALWVLSSLLLVTALLCGMKNIGKPWLAVAVVAWVGNAWYTNRPMAYVDIDSEYQRIWITDGTAQGRSTRYLSLNGHVNSGIWMDEPVKEQLFEYPNYFAFAGCLKPDFDRALMLGAGAFSFPKLFQLRWPEAELDVVEIDPMLLPISEQYFEFEAAPTTTVIHEDARTFLNRNELTYDIIFSDVFTSPLEVPFQMCTQEAYQRMHASLAEDGLLVVNVLGKTEGPRAGFLHTQLKLCRSFFEEVYVLQVQEGRPGGLKNLIIFASKIPLDIDFDGQTDCESLWEHRKSVEVPAATPWMTDDFAPANYLLKKG